MGPDEILVRRARLLACAGMDHHEVIDDTVPVRVELREVDGRVSGPHGLRDETIDRSVRVVHPRGTVRTVVRHGVRAVEPHRDHGRVHGQRTPGDLLVIRANRMRGRSRGIHPGVEVGAVMARIMRDVGEVDQKDDDPRHPGRLCGNRHRAGRLSSEIRGPCAHRGVRWHQQRPDVGRCLPVFRWRKSDQSHGRR